MAEDEYKNSRFVERVHYRTERALDDAFDVSVTLLQARSPQSAKTVNMRSVKHCHTFANHFGPSIMKFYHFMRHRQCMYANVQFLTFYGKM